MTLDAGLVAFERIVADVTRDVLPSFEELERQAANQRRLAQRAARAAETSPAPTAVDCSCSDTSTPD